MSAAPHAAQRQPVERRAGDRAAQLVEESLDRRFERRRRARARRAARVDLDRAGPRARSRRGRRAGTGRWRSPPGTPSCRPPPRRRRVGGRCDRRLAGAWWARRPSRPADRPRSAPAISSARDSSPPRRCMTGPMGAMSGRPTKRTGRPTAPPIDSAANTGASANRRALTTISAPSALRQPPVTVDRDVPAQTGQRPDTGDEVGIATPVVDHVTRGVDDVVERAAGSAGERARRPTRRQADDVGETVHHATATRAGVCTTLGQL